MTGPGPRSTSSCCRATGRARRSAPDSACPTGAFSARASAWPDRPSIRPCGPAAPARRPARLAYASTPFRGLDVLLDLFPRIRAAVPEAELDVFSSMRVYGMAESDDRKQFRALYRKAKQPGVTLVGSLPQLELARRLQEARLLAYPNHYAETFCIAVAEAEAAGCAIVTSALGALPETVGDAGVCVPGDPHGPAYQQAFVEACVTLLTDDARCEAMSGQGLARSWRDYAWPAIAEGWETVCRTALTVDSPVLDRVAMHLAAGRTGLAARMLERDVPAAIPADVRQGLAAVIAARTGEAATPPADTLRQVALWVPPFRRSGLLDTACTAHYRSCRMTSMNSDFTVVPATPPAQSVEQRMRTENLPRNLEAVDPYFGPFFTFMRRSLSSGGSELGLAMTLFSLGVSIRAAQIVEIGRFKGMSTLALASALRFNDMGWDEPEQHRQRPDVPYQLLEGPRTRRLISIDPFPTTEADRVIAEAGLTDYVIFVNHRSDAVQVAGQVDLLFIDGDHSYEGCRRDVDQYTPLVRPGGYFILHDYFGWYDEEGRNGSPIKRVADEIPEDQFPRLLIDTGYPSLVVFHRPLAATKG